MPLAGAREAFKARIDASKDDAAALSAIGDELRGLGEPWAGPLRFQVLDLRRRLKQHETPAAKSRPAVIGKPRIMSWGERFGLPPPDGQPLYRYRLSTQNYDALRDYLRQSVRGTGFVHPHDDALFVLWGAEWFRRSFTGGLRRWADLGDEIGLALSQIEWRRLADNGLRIWRLEPLVLNGLTHRLLSLARQGGFPLAAIDGWAASYLERLVGVLLAEDLPDADIAFAHAEKLSFMLPATWQSENFAAVSADLALAVVALRRSADARNPGVPASVWLDAVQPDWRNELPIVVDSAAARRLIDGLMKAIAVKGGSGSVSAFRMIEYRNDRWNPQVQFGLNGVFKEKSLSGLEKQWSRLRVFPAGQLAQYVPGELAVIEPGESGEWLSSATGANQRSFEIPLDVRLEIELRGDGRRVVDSMLLPNGTALTAQMLVCYSDEGEPTDFPSQLKIIATASGKFRPNPLFVLAPSDWNANPGADCEIVSCIRGFDDGRSLWRIEGGAIVRDSSGDAYRILAGQMRDDRDALSISGDFASGRLSSSVGTSIFTGKPALFVKEHGTNRALKNNEAWWRKSGSREWRNFASFDGFGSCDFAWRDHTTSHLRDRQTAIVLPDGFEIAVESHGDHALVHVEGWPGEIELSHGISAGSKSWRVSTRGSTQGNATLRLSATAIENVELNLRLPRQTWITDWPGKPTPVGGRLALADMHRYVARGDGRNCLTAELRDRLGTRVQQAELRWTFTDELPLNSIRDDVAGLLRPCGDLDATIRFAFNDTPNEYWSASEFDVVLQNEPRGLVPSRAVIDEDVAVVGRALHQPAIERELDKLGLPGQQDYRPLRFPNLKGTWLVYLRADERVLSRPAIVSERSLDDAPIDFLGRVMIEPDRAKRLLRLSELCQSAENDGSQGERIIQSILSLAKSLRGVPASTFDIFSMLPRHPLLAVRLLFEATEQDFDSVVCLEDGLPFCWSLIPKRFWHLAARMRCESILRALPESIQNKEMLAASAPAARCRRITERQPSLGTQLGLAKRTIGLAEAAQLFMQRSHDQAENLAGSPFRPQFEELLPKWQFSELFWRCLDAPCAAALVAAELVSLNDPQLRCVKEISRRHRAYFSQAFVSFSQEQNLA